MDSKAERRRGYCIGFLQETPNGGIYELGNSYVHRRILRLGNTVLTGSLVNVVNGEEYLDETNSEFSIELIGDYDRLVLTAPNFTFKGVHTPEWNDDEKILHFDMSADVLGEELGIALVYSCRARDCFQTKHLQIGPLTGWEIGEVVLEDMLLVEDVCGVDPSGTTGERFSFNCTSNSVMEFWGCREGLFALLDAEDGAVNYSPENNLKISYTANISTDSSHTGARAIVGTYTGQPERGFLSYRNTKLARCIVCQVPIEVPSGSLDAEAAAQVRSGVYRLAWKTPVRWIDTSPLRPLFEDVAELTKAEYLHVLVSLLGIVQTEDLLALARCANDGDSLEAAGYVLEFADKYAPYFEDYRHILAEPDGEQADGHAHFIDNSGFVVLVNPSDNQLEVDLMLDEVELDLAPGSKCTLSDWSSLRVGVPMDSGKVGEPLQIELSPLEVRIIGVNIKRDTPEPL